MPARDVDDGLAMTMALASDDFDLVGITTCSGNCYAHESTDITLRLLELAGRTDIPVGAGRDMPMLQDVTAHYQLLDEGSKRAAAAWADAAVLPPASGAIRPVPAHQLIIDTVRKYPNEVVIVKEGSFTNLAVALLVDPGIAPLIKGVVHMGGTIEPWWDTYIGRTNPEIWRYVLKLNTVYDPHATAMVMRSGIPLTFATINVCAQVRLRAVDIDRIAGVGTPYHDFIADVSRRWVDHVDYGDDIEGACMWDLLTLAIASRPELCQYLTLKCDPDRFLREEYPWLYSSEDGPQVRVTIGVDAPAFERFMMESLTRPIPAADEVEMQR